MVGGCRNNIVRTRRVQFHLLACGLFVRHAHLKQPASRFKQVLLSWNAKSAKSDLSPYINHRLFSQLQRRSTSTIFADFHLSRSGHSNRVLSLNHLVVV